MTISKLPGISYVRRYWWVLAMLYVGYIAMRSNSLFAVLDVFLYLPFAFAVWVALVLLWRNVFNRKTTDKFIDSGLSVVAFNALPEREKVWFTMIQTGFYLLGGAIIVAAIVSNLFPS